MLPHRSLAEKADTLATKEVFTFGNGKEALPNKYFLLPLW